MTDMTLQQVMRHFAPDLLAQVIVDMRCCACDAHGHDAEPYGVIACAARDELVANCGLQEGFRALREEDAPTECLFWFCRTSQPKV